MLNVKRKKLKISPPSIPPQRGKHKKSLNRGSSIMISNDESNAEVFYEVFE
jgi:hypothetical protein